MLDKLKEFDRMIRDKSWFTQGFIFLALMVCEFVCSHRATITLVDKVDLIGYRAFWCTCLCPQHHVRVGRGTIRAL